jgi:Tfp pilus assembly protein PilF
MTIEHAYDALQANRLDDARSGYEQVLRGDPRNADALLGLAVIATRQGQIRAGAADLSAGCSKSIPATSRRRRL